MTNSNSFFIKNVQQLLKLGYMAILKGFDITVSLTMYNKL